MDLYLMLVVFTCYKAGCGMAAAVCICAARAVGGGRGYSGSTAHSMHAVRTAKARTVEGLTMLRPQAR